MNDSITTVDVEKEISRSLYRFIFNRVVSRPYAEVRHNIHLDPITPNTCINSFEYNGNFYRLPYSGGWFVFIAHNNKINHINLPKVDNWTNLSNRTIKGSVELGYCTQHRIDIRIVCSTTGKCISRKNVYIIPESEQTYLVAIRQNAVEICEDVGETGVNDIWINFYYHHVNSKFTIMSYDDNASDFMKVIKNNHTQAFINGEAIVDPSKVKSGNLAKGDMLEVVYDDDIVGSFDVEIKVDYQSNSGYTLFHIPQSLNPEDHIIGHRVCDIVIYKEDNNLGRYLNRALTEKYVQTLTHNDFGISTGYMVNYGRDIAGNGTLRAKVYVRNHHRDDLKLSRDANYTQCLYKLNDEEIVKHLLGNGPVECWKASNLYKSAYAKILDTDYSEINERTLKDSIGALGYAAASDTVCKRVFHLPIAPGLTTSFVVPLPICYLPYKEVLAHIYIDGLMIDNDYVTYRKHNQYLCIDFAPNVKLGPYGCTMKSYEQYWNDLDRNDPHYLTVEVFDGNPYRASYLEIQPGGTGNVIIDQDVKIYQVVPISTVNRLKDHYLYRRFSVINSYREFTQDEYKNVTYEDFCGYRRLKITNPGTKTKVYLITSAHAYAKVYGVEHQLKEMNYDIFCSHLLMLQARKFPSIVAGVVKETDDMIEIPYLDKDRSLLVYLNHRELTEDLDYKTYSIDTVARYSCGQFVVFQNVDYLTVANNIFEVFSISEFKTIDTSGFLTDGAPTLEGYLASYENSGVLFADGRAYNHPPANMIGFEDVQLHKRVRKGASAKIRAYIPYTLKNVFDKYATYEHKTLDEVLKYMHDVITDTEAPAIIERSHHIYSIFLQTITELVLRGKLKYDLNWTDERIKANLKPYNDLIKYDLGLRKENIEVTDPNEFIKPPKSGIDYRFVDVLPTYRVAPHDPDLVVQDQYPVIRISESDIDSVNGTYICMNQDLSFIRPGEIYEPLPTETGRYNDITVQVWENSTGARIGRSGEYWTIYDDEDNPRYQAFDCRDVDDIWNLKWEPVENAFPITIDTTSIEIHTAGEFPARRYSYTASINDKNFLTRVARLYLNKDLVQDGVNIEP